MIGGMFGGARDYMNSGQATEVDVPEAVPQGGKFRDIVSQK